MYALNRFHDRRRRPLRPALGSGKERCLRAGNHQDFSKSFDLGTPKLEDSRKSRDSPRLALRPEDMCVHDLAVGLFDIPTPKHLDGNSSRQVDNLNTSGMSADRGEAAVNSALR
jgi:hypothetical protein